MKESSKCKIYELNDFVEYKNNKPIVKKTIEVGETFKGGVLYKDGKSYYKLTRKGYKFDEIVSLLQKAIRRGLLVPALFCANELIDMGLVYYHHLLNRLKVIVSEDIGIANQNIVIKFVRNMKKIEKNEDFVKNSKEIKRLVFGIVTALTKSKKNRLVDCIIHYVMEPKVKYLPIGVNEIVDDNIDNLSFNEIFEKFKSAIDRKSELFACYYAQAIYDLEQKLYGKDRLKNSRDSFSNDAIYSIWDYLEKKALNTKDKVDWDIHKSLFWLFDNLKNKRRPERLFFTNSILYECRRNAAKKVFLSEEDLKDYFLISDERLNEIILFENIEMPGYAVDKHTIAGKNSNVSTNDFWNDGSKLNNTVAKFENDNYRVCARRMDKERESEGIVPRKRGYNWVNKKKKSGVKRKRNEKKEKKAKKKVKLLNVK